MRASAELYVEPPYVELSAALGAEPPYAELRVELLLSLVELRAGKPYSVGLL